MTTETRSPRLLDGKATAKEIRSEVARGCAELARDHGVVPGLTVVQVGDDPASRIYVRNKERASRNPSRPIDCGSTTAAASSDAPFHAG